MFGRETQRAVAALEQGDKVATLSAGGLKRGYRRRHA